MIKAQLKIVESKKKGYKRIKKSIKNFDYSSKFLIMNIHWEMKNSSMKIFEILTPFPQWKLKHNQENFELVNASKLSLKYLKMQSIIEY